MGAIGRHGCGSERPPKLGGGFSDSGECVTWYYSTYCTVDTERTSENIPQSGTQCQGVRKILFSDTHSGVCG